MKHYDGKLINEYEVKPKTETTFEYLDNKNQQISSKTDDKGNLIFSSVVEFNEIGDTTRYEVDFFNTKNSISNYSFYEYDEDENYIERETYIEQGTETIKRISTRTIIYQ